jgi:glucosamine-6-phosphate deaminase
MQIHILPDYYALSRHVADLIGDYLAQAPRALVCLPSGESPVGVFECLVADAREGKTDFSQCFFVGLDEWLGMDETNPGSCKHIVNKHFLAPLGLPPGQYHFFDAKAADLAAECARMNELIASWGGLDIMLVGLGLNGHIALNEPGTPFDSYAHVAELDELTVTVGQKYFTEATALSGGITLGLRHFAEAKLPVLIASGARKADIVGLALRGPVTEQVPASLLQRLGQAIVGLDQAAASRLNQAG